MLSPGSITNSVPDPDEPLRLQRDVQRNAQEQASARSLQQSQIGAGGLLINNGGSLTIAGTGALNVGSGALNSAGSISAGTTITAAGAITGASVTATGAVTGATVVATTSVTAPSVTATGAVSGASVGASGAVTGASVTATGAVNGATVTAGGVVNGASFVASTTINAGTDITANGNLTANANATAQNIFGTSIFAANAGNVAGNITAARTSPWVRNSDGYIGNTLSSIRFKTDVVDTTIDPLAVLGISVKHYNYITEVRKRDDPTFADYVGPGYHVATEVGMIAEDLHAAGLWQFVVYQREYDADGNEVLSLDAGGQPIPDSIHYTLWALAVLVATQHVWTEHLKVRADTDMILAHLGLTATA